MFFTNIFLRFYFYTWPFWTCTFLRKIWHTTQWCFGRFPLPGYTRHHNACLNRIIFKYYRVYAKNIRIQVYVKSANCSKLVYAVYARILHPLPKNIKPLTVPISPVLQYLNLSKPMLVDRRKRLNTESWWTLPIYYPRWTLRFLEVPLVFFFQPTVFKTKFQANKEPSFSL